MNNKGMLFTDEKPNFCDIQQEICDTMDTLLAQMEAQNNISRLQVTDPYSTEALRYSNTSMRGRFNQRNTQLRSGTFARSNVTANLTTRSKKNV